LVTVVLDVLAERLEFGLFEQLAEGKTTDRPSVLRMWAWPGRVQVKRLLAILLPETPPAYERELLSTTS
jgi:hypothetical protein